MAQLTRDDVLKLARLARIDLTDDEVTEFSNEFTAILGYVEQLQAVDIEGLEPTSQVTGLTNVTRKDEVKNYGYKTEDLRANVPHMQEDLLKMPRMIG